MHGDTDQYHGGLIAEIEKEVYAETREVADINWNDRA